MRNPLMSRLNGMFILLCVGCLVSLSSTSLAQTIYVATTGTDDMSCVEAGNLETPKRTIAAALRCLQQPGQTVVLRKGTYSESLVFSAQDSLFPAGVSWQEPITLQAYQDEQVILHPGAGKAGIYVTDPALQVLHVKGLHIEATGLATGVYVKGPHHVRLTQLNISGATGAGVYVSTSRSRAAQAPQVVLDEVKVHHNGQEGVRVESTRVHIQHSQVHENGGSGLVITEPAVATKAFQALRVWNNRIWGNGPPEQGWGIQVDSEGPAILYGNIVDRQGHGIRLAGRGTTTHLVAHNTLVGPGGEGIRIAGALKGVRLVNNIIVGYETNLVTDEGATVEESHNLFEAPGFLDYAHHNLHLGPDSPAIDTGLPLPELLVGLAQPDLTDVEGQPRPVGDGWDIGAFERPSVPPPPPMASFTATPRSGVPPLRVTFLDQSTGKITQWHWDFGDGTVSTERHPTHEYVKAGIYQVQLTVTGPGGTDRMQQAQAFHIRSTHLHAAFSAKPLSGLAPLQVTLTNQSLGEAISWFWDFGDGTTSQDRHPVHHYVTPGIYRPQLTLRGPQGESAFLQGTQPIVVQPPLGSVLYQEEWTGKNLDQWEVVDEGRWQGPSNWTGRAGSISQTSNIWSPPSTATDLPKLGTMLWFRPGESWRDYRLTLQMTSSDNDTLGVVFRYQDPDNYYRFSWDNERGVRRLVKCVDGQFSLLAEEAVKERQLVPSTVHIDVFGPNIQVSLNSQELFGGGLQDASLSVGSMGLYTWFDNGSRFSRIHVEEFVMPTPNASLHTGRTP